MDEYLRLWEPVLRSFEEHYAIPFIERDEDVPYHVVDWYPVGHTEINVKMSDGTRYAYDFINCRIMPLYDRTALIDKTKEAIGKDEIAWRRNFSKRLRIKMSKTGTTRERLSELTGISEVMLSKYANAQASPSGYKIELMSRALNCSTTELTSVY